MVWFEEIWLRSKKDLKSATMRMQKLAMVVRRIVSKKCAATVGSIMVKVAMMRMTTQLMSVISASYRRPTVLEIVRGKSQTIYACRGLATILVSKLVLMVPTVEELTVLRVGVYAQ